MVAAKKPAETAEITVQARDFARDFARDLRVRFEVEEIGGRKPVRVSVMPLVLSPMEGRRTGGGYVLTDPEDPSHMVEHCRQGAVALRAWLNRYSSALAFAQGSSAAIQDAVALLEAVPSQATDEAA